MTEFRYCLRGEVDLSTAAELRADLAGVIRTSGAHLLVDCTHLTFIDSMGITVLLEANHQLEAEGRHMLVVNAHGGPRRAFEILGLGDLLRYDRDPCAAIPPG